MANENSTLAVSDRNLLSAYSISNNLKSYEAARSGFFTLIVDNLDNIIRADYSGNKEDLSDSDKISNAQNYLQLNVTKAPVPHFTLEKLSYKRGNEVVNFAGTPSWSDGEITVDDVVGLDTKSILMAWQAAAYDVNTGKGGRMADYKKTCTLVEYTQDYEQIRSWTLYGCWISSLSEDDFDKENDGKRQIRATIVYDRAVMERPSEE